MAEQERTIILRGPSGGRWTWRNRFVCWLRGHLIPPGPPTHSGENIDTETLREFRDELANRGVVWALCHAPFGYTSRIVEGRYRFRVDSGPLKGAEGEAATLDEAVRLACETVRPLSVRAPSEETK